jgi:predicted ArsR family transcriptional regulator
MWTRFTGMRGMIIPPYQSPVCSCRAEPALALDAPLDFTTLKKRLDLSDGAIAPHLRKLEEISYVLCRKAFVGRRPKSTYRITAAGRKALAGYLDAMQALIDALK